MSSRRPLMLARLTKVERETLTLVAQDLTYAEIAELLFVAPETVKWRVKQICTKLDVRTRLGAAVVYARESAAQTALGAAPSLTGDPRTLARIIARRNLHAMIDKPDDQAAA